MADLLRLHTQDLTDMMAELERNDSQDFQTVYNLAAAGNVYSLNEQELGPLRRKGTVFSRNKWASPVLTNDIPLATLLHPNQIRRILINEIGTENPSHFFPSRGHPEDDGRAIVELLNNVANPHYSKPGSILHMHSPSFERLCQYKTEWPSDGMLDVSDVAMAVTPATDAQDMEYCDRYILSTLLSGSKVWLTYPPLDANLAALQAEFEATVDNAARHTLDNLSRFQHGIAFTQRAGQILVLPPFWIAVNLTTQTSVSCAYHIATAALFPERIKNINSFLVTTQLSPQEADYGQQRLVTFAIEFIEHLRLVLADDFPHYNNSKVILAVCRAYDQLRAGLRRVLDAIDDKAVMRGLENTYRVAWLSFLEQKRKKMSTCRLCNLRTQDMPVGEFPMDRLRQHFIDVHCLRGAPPVQSNAHM
ncbi:hypothetical protein C7974DRAFT_400355 [Boeremia exigua]|uniref:uncharacterized protein n=1 Tax=Boeremia exigua TaxID=749465 RepID=UPI001E8DC23A|nr:uncharacterized protein C7974DRAFT_400355 [Boeremia exigua]KAH6618554.1 hypothetical protein C7974DRAFT_400355 [Boeremia exigua]